jgi:hypothetical protein
MARSRPLLKSQSPENRNPDFWITQDSTLFE